MAIIRLVAIFSLSLLKILQMEVIYGWVQPQPGTTNLRDWSTFRTTFPGPGGGWMKVFQISQCCPNVDPPLEECDVFLNRGADIVILRDFTDLEVLATGPSQYTDIAILGDKLYARKFTGWLDEFTIGISSVTLTTPDIHNIGTGTSLASDGTYLIYDVNSGVNVGKIVRTSPGSWGEEIYALADPVTLQGDIMVVGGNRLAMSTFKNSSSILIIENDPVTPTIYTDTQIKNTSNTLISAVYGMFQRGGVLYIVRADGTYYSMSSTWPIVFQNQGQFILSGITYGDWNGAAQSGECGTITPPDPDDPPGMTVKAILTTDGEELPGSSILDFVVSDDNQDIMNRPVTDFSPGFYESQTVTDGVGPFEINFATQLVGPPLEYKIEVTENSDPPYIVGSGIAEPNDTYSHVVTGIVGPEVEIKTTFIRVEVPLTTTVFSTAPYPGLLLTNVEVQDGTQYLINQASVDFTTIKNFTNTVVDCTAPMLVKFTNSGSVTVRYIISRNYDGTGWVTLADSTLAPAGVFNQTYPLTAVVEGEFRVEFRGVEDTLKYDLVFRNEADPALENVTLENVTLKGVSTDIIVAGDVNTDTPPSSQLFTANAPKQDITVDFSTLDIPQCAADIYVSIDEGVEVFVETLDIDLVSSYSKAFDTGAANSVFRVIYEMRYRDAFDEPPGDDLRLVAPGDLDEDDDNLILLKQE